MQVEVRLFAAFRKGRFKTRAMDLADGTSLRDLLRELDIPEGKVTMPLVNGRHAELDTPLAADDVVAVFPAIAGG